MQQGKKTKLDAEKVAELDSLEFMWEEPPSEAAGAIVNDAVHEAFAAHAAAPAAVAEVDHDVPMDELEPMPVMGEHPAEEATAEDIMHATAI